MVRTDAHSKSKDTATAVAVWRRARLLHFGLHFVEMVAAMGVGMAVGMPIYRAVAGISSAEQYRLYPVPSVSAMALTMALRWWVSVLALRHSGTGRTALPRAFSRCPS